MDCVDVADRLLADEPGHDPELAQHVDGCAACAHIARGLARVEVLLASALVIAPPPELQLRLAQIALEAARPLPQPWWQRAQALGHVEDQVHAGAFADLVQAGHVDDVAGQGTDPVDGHDTGPR